MPFEVMLAVAVIVFSPASVFAVKVNADPF